MKTTYCEGWFRGKKRAQGIWDESTARAAHERGDLYTAVLSDATRPQCFLEITGDYMGVSFLDQKLRVYMDYQFQKLEAAKMFFSMAVTREFVGDGGDVRMGTAYSFQDDGRIMIREEDHEADTLAEGEIWVDQTHNWVEYPPFGEYQKVTWQGRLDAILNTWDGKTYRSLTGRTPEKGRG